MGQEIDGRTAFGITLLIFGIVIAFGFGVYNIASEVANEAVTEAVTEATVVETVHEIYISLYAVYMFIISVVSILLGLWLKYKNSELDVWGDLGNKHNDDIISACNFNKYEEIKTVSIPQRVGLFTAARCRVSKIRELKTISFNRRLEKNIKGIVHIDKNFYIIGENKLARGLILLHEGDNVNFNIECASNVESALNIFRIYDVVK